VPHSDGSTFADETEYSQGDATGRVAWTVGLRSTTLLLDNLVLPEPLLGGEWLSIDHPTMRWRAYRIAEILEYNQIAGTATVKIRPPLREAVRDGEQVDFSTPRCTMHIDGSMPSPTRMGYAESSGVRFVEDFAGSYA